MQRGFPTVLLISKNRLVTKIGATISEGHACRRVAQPDYRFDLIFHRFHCNIPSMVVFQINSAEFVTDSIKAMDIRMRQLARRMLRIKSFMSATLESKPTNARHALTAYRFVPLFLARLCIDLSLLISSSWTVLTP